MEPNRVGFWQSHFGWAIELGYRIMNSIFGDNFPVPAGPPLEPSARSPEVVVVARKPHTRRCHENHDRPSDPDPVGHTTPASTDRALRTNLALALRRFIQFGGLVQYVAEVTGMARDVVVYRTVEAKIGSINNRIRAEHPALFEELQRCLDNMQAAFADEMDYVLEDYSRAQAERLQLLNAVDFGGNVVPLVRENLKCMQEDCLDILRGYNMEGELRDEISSFTFHELFLYGQKGYRMCYYDIEREQGA